MYNVLVCDDEKDIVSALQIYLKSEGYQVFSAYNGKEALKIINREDIQLVLMDIMMPEMDGIEAMCKIREISMFRFVFFFFFFFFFYYNIFRTSWISSRFIIFKASFPL